MRKHDETLLANCTASGKSVIALSVASKLQQTDRKCVLISTPFINGKNSLSKYAKRSVAMNHGNGLKCTPIIISNIEIELSTVELSNSIITEQCDCVHATTHATVAHMYKIFKLMHNVDLTNFVYMVDEAHHKSLSKQDATLLGKFIEYVRNHGGKIMYISATPYREYSNRTELIYNPNIIGHIEIRTVGEQMRDGYAPNVSVKYMTMDNADELLPNGGIYGDLSKSHIKQKALIKYTKKIIDSWVADGCPKCIFLIPSGNSEHDAKIVKELFEKVLFDTIIASKRGRTIPSVLVTLNGMNPNIEVNGESVDALQADAQENGRMYDVIIGCKKFDEATDVPSASHLYMIGIPSNTRLFHQRLGRIIRSKHEVIGYSEFFGDRWLNNAQIVFMAPFGCVINNFETQVSQQLMLIMLSAESYENFCEATNHVGSARIEIENAMGEYDEDDAELADGLANKINSMELTYNATRSNEEYSLFTKIISEHPTVGNEYDSIMHNGCLTDDEKLNKVYALIQHLNCGSEAWKNFAETGLKEYVETRKKIRSKILNPNKIIHEGFQRIVEEFRDNELLDTMSDNIKSVYTDITGDTFETYANKIIDELNNQVVSEFVLFRDIATFKNIHGRLPLIDSPNEYERNLAMEYSVWVEDHKIEDRDIKL